MVWIEWMYDRIMKLIIFYAKIVFAGYLKEIYGYMHY